MLHYRASNVQLAITFAILSLFWNFKFYFSSVFCALPNALLRISKFVERNNCAREGTLHGCGCMQLQLPELQRTITFSPPYEFWNFKALFRPVLWALPNALLRISKSVERNNCAREGTLHGCGCMQLQLPELQRTITFSPPYEFWNFKARFRSVLRALSNALLEILKFAK